MSYTQCHFLIPDPRAFPSGGNIYNRHLINALSEKGTHVSHSEFQPDVLYASPHTLYFLDSIYFARVTDPNVQIPPHCVGLIHHLASLYPEHSSFRIENEDLLLRTFEHFLVSSNFTRSYLQGRGYAGAAIHVIEPAPLQTRHPRTPARKVRALVLGNCTERKGQLPLMKSLAALDIPPYYELTIAGSLTVDPDYARACQEVVLHSDHLRRCVRFTGEQDASVISKLYGKSNLFISSSAMETFGMAIQDAVVSGIPILVLEGGYAGSHVSPEVNGRCCPDIATLASAFEAYVRDSDGFLRIQHRAAHFQHPYHTWEEAARTFIAAFLPNIQ